MFHSLTNESRCSQIVEAGIRDRLKQSPCCRISVLRRTMPCECLSWNCTMSSRFVITALKLLYPVACRGSNNHAPVIPRDCGAAELPQNSRIGLR